MIDNPIYEPPASEPMNPLFSEAELSILNAIESRIPLWNTEDGVIPKIDDLALFMKTVLPKLKNLSVPRQTADTSIGN